LRETWRETPEPDGQLADRRIVAIVVSAAGRVDEQSGLERTEADFADQHAANAAPPTHVRAGRVDALARDATRDRQHRIPGGIGIEAQTCAIAAGRIDRWASETAEVGGFGRHPERRMDKDSRRIGDVELAVDRVETGTQRRPVIQERLLQPGLEDAAAV
jgi:hypothetical protein